MIDLHAHVLPHIDDGAKDTATAVAMLEQELAQGVDTVVLTSHYYGKKHSPAHFLEKRKAAFERLQSKIPAGLSVRLGAEVHFTGINEPDFEALCKLAIEGTRYILIEFPFTCKWEGTLLERLSDFIAETGFTPVVAHVERYGEVQKNPALVNELIEMGCLIQVNAGSFLNKKEKGLAFALLRHGLVHGLGSDAHDTGSRRPNFSEAMAAVEERGLSSSWAYAQSCMKTLIEGGQVCVERKKPVKKFLWKYL